MSDTQTEVEVVEEESTEQPDVATLQSQLAEARAEAAKLKAIKNTIAKERDDLKKATKQTEPSEDYKSLYAAQRDENGKLVQSIRSNAVETALRGQLSKVGVVPEAVEAAVKLADHSRVQWDLENGVDREDVEAVVKVLKGNHKFLFEQKVSATNPKLPSDKGAKSEMSRSEWSKLSPVDQAAAVKKFVLVD